MGHFVWLGVSVGVIFCVIAVVFHFMYRVAPPFPSLMYVRAVFVSTSPEDEIARFLLDLRNFTAYPSSCLPNVRPYYEHASHRSLSLLFAPEVDFACYSTSSSLFFCDSRIKLPCWPVSVPYCIYSGSLPASTSDPSVAQLIRVWPVLSSRYPWRKECMWSFGSLSSVYIWIFDALYCIGYSPTNRCVARASPSLNF